MLFKLNSYLLSTNLTFFSNAHSFSDTLVTVKVDVLFLRNFANFHHNGRILIGSLLWAICNRLEQLAWESCKFASMGSSVDSSSNWKFRLEHGLVDF